MRQTAVEWLEKELPKYGSGAVRTFRDLFEQAKEMEKEQTLLFSEKYDEYVFRGGSATAEQYYNETFKSE